MSATAKVDNDDEGHGVDNKTKVMAKMPSREDILKGSVGKVGKKSDKCGMYKTQENKANIQSLQSTLSRPEEYE